MVFFIRVREKKMATSLYVLYIAIAYIMHSFIEWGVHMYMHNFEQLHIDHHDDEDEDEESGLYFSLTNPKVILMMYIPSLLLMALYKHLFSNVDFKVLFLIHTTFLVYGITVWNSLHGYMHGFDCSTRPFEETSGLCFNNKTTEKILEILPCLNFFIESHRTHHRTRNSNYTVVFPFADFVMGTYESPN